MKKISRHSILNGILLTIVIAVLGAPSARAQLEEDPLVTFVYSLTVEGKLGGYFTEVEGIGSETEVTEQKVADPNTGEETIRKMPGRLTWSDVVLKRGVTSNMDIWTWRKQVESGDIAEARANASITMHDEEGTPVAVWNFVNAWPSKIYAPDVPGDAEATGIETLTLVHEGYERVQ